ncbi:MAG: hypothetical protein WCE38_11790 [Burkholderiales bacterium]
MDTQTTLQPADDALPGDAATIAACRRFNAVLLIGLGAILAVVVGLNLLLGERAVGTPEAVKAASKWQQATRGITYPPPITANRPFKSLRLADRLPEINGVVLGASTSMGLTADAFPPDVRIYNFAQTANPLHATIGEAEYIVHHHADRVKWIFLALDWSVGMLYLPGEAMKIDLSPTAAVSRGALPQVSFLQKLQDAISWPRVRNLWSIVRLIWRSPEGIAAFKRALLDTSSADYRCPDGTPARDFDTINRGSCAGFRYDGSATFADGHPVDPARLDELVWAGAAAGSRYSRPIVQGEGKLNPALLAGLAKLSSELTAQGGKLVLFAPPLIPGLERALGESAHAGSSVARTKMALDEWAKRTGLVIIDAGASERFGCTAPEFLDEHHAYPACYRKVFARFWERYASGRPITPGLWVPGLGSTN